MRRVYLVIFLVLYCFTHATQADTVTVNFEVAAPADTPEDATLYLAGNHAMLGAWRADGAALERGEDGVHRATVELPIGYAVEYKVTRGDWATVEKAADGSEIANRTITADADQTVAITVARWNEPGDAPRREPLEPSVTGDVRVIESFESDILSNQRAIRVYLPPGYDDPANADERYPVLYLHDGQNQFDRATAAFGVEWQTDEAAQRLIEAGDIPPIIMVAIDNTGGARMNEYTPWPGEGERFAGIGGGGPDYARFLIEELKPHVDREYRTKPDRKHTATAGSSLGGLISLYLLTEHHDTFGRAAALSPSLFWAERRMTRTIEADPTKLRGAHLWLDMGTEELGAGARSDQHVSDVQHLANILESNADALDFRFTFVLAEGGAHTEAAWAKRMPDVLVFLFGEED